MHPLVDALGIANTQSAGAKLRFRSLHGGDIDDTHDACGFSNKLALRDRSCSSSVGMLSNDLDNLVRCFVILKNGKHLLRRLG